MRAMLFVSNIMIPLLFVVIIVYGLLKKVRVYDAFIEGAKDGFSTVLTILPTLIGLMVSIGILRTSGALTALSSLLQPACATIGFPEPALPLTLMRLVSSSASVGLLLDIFKTYGPDSFTGRFVSVMMSSTETIFYTLSIYFVAVKITKTRYTLAGALIANFAGIAASLIITDLVFGR
ncbi:MAG: spore maturation protein [Defluviitaleaceae bacterium]|nr:spore maturation protein [Defluviitaleaceae bacterium]MCL2835339.1 spore maturation protein [Defluviitaleaceae bacterium]